MTVTKDRPYHSKFEKWRAGLNEKDRIRIARERTSALVDHLVLILELHESNKIIVYSKQLSGQIPRSFAAHTFNRFQESMHSYEIMRLCALWDMPGTDRISLPTVLALLEVPGTMEAAAQFNSDDVLSRGIPQFSNSAKDDAFTRRWKEEWAERDRDARAVQQFEDDKAGLAFASAQTREISAGLLLQSIRNRRDQFIAHNLSQPATPTVADVKPMKYGDDTLLIDLSIPIVNALNLALNNSAYAWEMAKDQTKALAGALWNRCTFTVASADGGKST